MLINLKLMARRLPGHLARLRYGPRPKGIEFVKYGWSNIEIAVSNPPVSDDLRGRIAEGSYEGLEAKSIETLFDADEVVVELGAGVGLMSTLAMKSGKVRAVHVFEADERLVPLIEATHKQNGLKNTTVHNFAVTADPEALSRGHIDLVLRDNFFGNSIRAKQGQPATSVPTKSLNSIIGEYHPTILIIDIEGAEAGLFNGVDLSEVKRVSIEIHPHHLAKTGVRSVFDDLHAAGLVYDARYSHGAVPVFSRKVR